MTLVDSHPHCSRAADTLTGLGLTGLVGAAGADATAEGGAAGPGSALKALERTFFLGDGDVFFGGFIGDDSWDMIMKDFRFHRAR